MTTEQKIQFIEYFHEALKIKYPLEDMATKTDIANTVAAMKGGDLPENADTLKELADLIIASVGGVDEATVNQLIVDYVANNNISDKAYVDTNVTNAIDTVRGGVDTAYDTLKKIVDYIPTVSGSNNVIVEPRTIIERTGLTETDVKTLIAEYINTIPNTQYKTSIVYEWNKTVPAIRGEYQPVRYLDIGNGVSGSYGIAYANDKGWLYVAGAASKKIFIIDTETFTIRDTIDLSYIDQNGLYTVSVTPDGQRLVAGFSWTSGKINNVTLELQSDNTYVVTQEIDTGYISGNSSIDAIGKTMVVSGNVVNKFKIYELSEQGTWEQVKEYTNLPGTITRDVRITADGLEIYFNSGSNENDTNFYSVRKVDGIWSDIIESNVIPKPNTTGIYWGEWGNHITLDKQVFYVADFHYDNDRGKIDVYYKNNELVVLYPFENKTDPVISTTPFTFSAVSRIPGSGFTDTVKKYGNYAKVMNGANDGLVIENLSMASQSYTFNVWIYRSDHSVKNDGDTSIRDYAFVSGGYWEDNGFTLSVENNDGNLALYSNRTSGISEAIEPSKPLNGWNMYTLVTTPTNTVVYVDGVKVYEDTTGRYNKFDNTWIAIGSAYQQVSDTDTTKDFMFELNGYIDELAIFDRVLTDAEIQDLYDDNTSGWQYQKSIYPPTQIVTDSIYKTLSAKHHFPFNGDTSDSLGVLTPSVAGSVSYEIGKFDQALRLVNTDDGLLFNLGSEVVYTIGFWIKPTSTADKAMPLYWYIDDNNLGFLYFDNGYIKFYTKNNGTVVSNYDEVTQISSDWQHITLVFDNGLKLYMNGVYNRSLTNNGANIQGTLQLGYSYDTQYRFDGLVDDLFMFDRILTDTEISDIYNYSGNTQTLPNFNRFGVGITSNFDNTKLYVSDYDSHILEFSIDNPYILDAYSADPFEDGSLIHFYPLDSDVSDVVGTLNGVEVNSPTYIGAKFNSGIKLVSSAYQAVSFDQLDATTITVSCFINIESITNTLMGIFYLGYDTSSTEQAFNLSISGGKVSLFSITPNNDKAIVTDFDVEVNRDYHIVGIKDNNYMALYVDGVLIGELNSDETLLGGLKDAMIGRVGTAGQGNDRHFNGVIDHLQIFNRALTAEEVQKLYTAEIKG